MGFDQSEHVQGPIYVLIGIIHVHICRSHGEWHKLKTLQDGVKLCGTVTKITTFQSKP